MADQTEETAVPDPRDIRIQDLEAQVKSLHDEANQMNEHFDEMVAGYESTIDKLRAQLDVTAPAAGPVPDGVYVGGIRHESLGTFRADNTFAPVKQGYCPEGVTLVAIDRAH